MTILLPTNLPDIIAKMKALLAEEAGGFSKLKLGYYCQDNLPALIEGCERLQLSSADAWVFTKHLEKENTELKQRLEILKNASAEYYSTAAVLADVMEGRGDYFKTSTIGKCLEKQERAISLFKYALVKIKRREGDTNTGSIATQAIGETNQILGGSDE